MSSLSFSQITDGDHSLHPCPSQLPPYHSGQGSVSPPDQQPRAVSPCPTCRGQAACSPLLRKNSLSRTSSLLRCSFQSSSPDWCWGSGQGSDLTPQLPPMLVSQDATGPHQILTQQWQQEQHQSKKQQLHSLVLSSVLGKNNKQNHLEVHSRLELQHEFFEGGIKNSLGQFAL